ncbi:DUF2249 domain-containing protein [Nostocoides sp. Soil756]|jgi:uncharacterized protein (DUF2249 family)|uniref:DUF2249 domain-containing protein n=1 Tax=Nostocoides sp. Soil756 TaxID=1736399 RepID=UPI0006F9265C|nr:DUF2249 domain-containing protein [Tetrasphaera sp. Soil756]KRE61231.1 hypothetical protein ASG78_12945 [Tetrasphaera sp. Soil756]
MTALTISSSSADAEAVDAVTNHHALMSGELALLVADLLNASGGDPTAARDRLVAWARESLVPHAMAEEKSLYPAAGGLAEGRLLVEAMLAEHVAIVAMVDEVEKAATPVGAAASGRALQALFAVHLDKENDQLLPLLAASPDHSVADLLAGMHELLGGHEGHDHEHPAESGAEAEPASHHGGSSCTCGTVDPPGNPALDVRVIPHAIRHATIFGALDAVAPGAGLEIVADHDPVPLLHQVQQRTPGRFEVTYLERGPVDYRILFTARA